MNQEKTLICDDEDDLCLTYDLLNTIGKKWTICLISILDETNEYRFNELKSKLQGISPKTLTKRLKELEKNELIKREVEPESPPKVTYTLTEEGANLKQSLYPLLEWVKKQNR